MRLSDYFDKLFDQLNGCMRLSSEGMIAFEELYQAIRRKLVDVGGIEIEVEDELIVSAVKTTFDFLHEKHGLVMRVCLPSRGANIEQIAGKLLSAAASKYAPEFPVGDVWWNDKELFKSACLGISAFSCAVIDPAREALLVDSQIAQADETIQQQREHEQFAKHVMQTVLSLSKPDVFLTVANHLRTLSGVEEQGVLLARTFRLLGELGHKPDAAELAAILSSPPVAREDLN